MVVGLQRRWSRKPERLTISLSKHVSSFHRVGFCSSAHVLLDSFTAVNLRGNQFCLELSSQYVLHLYPESATLTFWYFPNLFFFSLSPFTALSSWGIYLRAYSRACLAKKRCGFSWSAWTLLEKRPFCTN